MLCLSCLLFTFSVSLKSSFSILPAAHLLMLLVSPSPSLPDLSRLLHALIHELILQLLQHYPGSYLSQAQEGNLRYLTSFTSPSAAVEWCLTFQKAALYLAYPEPLLNLSSFAVQVDAKGRLVFRGPRFKMGLCEGSPSSITPSGEGRAEYHGALVSQAGRYADGAAHGGQIVADVGLAVKVLRSWRLSSSSSSRDDGGGGDGGGGASGELLVGHSQSSSSFVRSAAVADEQLQQSQQKQQQQPWGSISAPNEVVCSSNSRRDLDTDNALLSSHLPVADEGSLPCFLAYAAESHRDSSATVPPGSGSSNTGPAASPTAVAVDLTWLGSYLFKGNPNPLEMVGFSPGCLTGRSYPAEPPKGKGLRVVQRVGVMDRILVRLPAVVEEPQRSNMRLLA